MALGYFAGRKKIVDKSERSIAKLGDEIRAPDLIVRRHGSDAGETALG